MRLTVRPARRLPLYFQWVMALLGLLLLPPGAAADESPAAMAERYAFQVDKRLVLPAEEADRYGELALLMLSAAGIELSQPQYLLLVDRSPQVQALLLFWLSPQAAPLLIGASPVSTGRLGEFEYFETPTGVFEHSTLNPDYRAEGTFNEHGIRGFGLRGMRVFDFGWQQARRGWGAGGYSTMRLLLHATDPELLEPKLGSVQSKGCVRLPATLNQLLDQYGLLDAAYADALRAGQSFWALAPQHTPVPDAGRYMIVVDTGRVTRPDWSPNPLKPVPQRRPAPFSTPSP